MEHMHVSFLFCCRCHVVGTGTRAEFHELLSAVLKQLSLVKTSKMFLVPRSAVKDYFKGKDTDIERR
jgi:hypothetical protein